jgi:hypothetical protein
MTPLSTILGALAVWRLTHALHAEEGPWQTMVQLRTRLRPLTHALDCFYCLSVWVALPMAAALAGATPDALLLWPALSGAAILLERATAPPAIWHEDPPVPEGGPDELLRQEAALQPPRD